MSEKGTNEDALPVEVIHRIQSLMPPKEAANTCMLSKSWLHAWYTIPTFTIIPSKPDKLFYNWHHATSYSTFINTTLKRYHRDNMPIESFHLRLYTQGGYLHTEDVKYWIQLAVSRNCLKELSIQIGLFSNGTLILPDEIFSSQNLHIISVDGIQRGNMSLPVCTNPRAINCVSLRILNLSCVFITPCMFYNLLSTCTLLEKIILHNCEGLNGKAENSYIMSVIHNRLRLPVCSNPRLIKCVSLRILDLESVTITPDMFHNLLSTCTLLEKIILWCCEGFKKVKVKNLHLSELKIVSMEENDLWDINTVPRLCSFSYSATWPAWRKVIPFQIESLASVTQLRIERVMIDSSFFKTLESKFSVLESLTLKIDSWKDESMVITSVSLKWLTLGLRLLPSEPVTNIQVYAPKLLSFIYTGKIPGLLFQTIAPEQVKLTFYSRETLGPSYFLKMREALNSSSKFDINIESANLDSVVRLKNIDVDDLRRRDLFPVGNVQLTLETCSDEYTWEQSRFFDALFLICHPSYIKSSYVVIKKMMEGNTTTLKEVLLKNPDNGNWEALTSSWLSVLRTFPGDLECKLIWFPQ